MGIQFPPDICDNFYYIFAGNYPAWMRVYVNDEPVDIFEGARICDALNKYFSERLSVFDPGLIRIFDAHGNILFQDGSMSEYDNIFITESE